MSKQIAFFDFDNTITYKDSFIEFLFYSNTITKICLKSLFLSPLIILYFFKIIPNWRLKEIFLTAFFANLELDTFKKMADEFSKEKLPSIVKHEALEEIKFYKSKNVSVVIVSASVDLWLASWCANYGLDLISSKLEVKENKITGKLEGKNCYGIEKVNRIRAVYNLKEFDKIYAYGDSKGDIEMLALADEKYYQWKKI